MIIAPNLRYLWTAYRILAGGYAVAVAVAAAEKIVHCLKGTRVEI